MNHLRNNRGSMTIEATLIVSALVLILIAIIFAFMVIYQKTVLSQAASEAAQQGAEIWVDLRRDQNTNSTGETEKMKLGELYGSLIDFGKKYEVTVDVFSEAGKITEQGNGSQQDRKMAKIRQMVCDELYRGLLKPKDTKLGIYFNNTVLERKITVTVVQEIQVPLGGIKKFFSGKETITLTGTGTSVVADPAEYIRNVDLGVEYAHRAVNALSLTDKLKALKEKIMGGG